MEEPNLAYIKKIAKGSVSFEKDILNIVNEELEGEIESYYSYFEAGDLKKAKIYVHRIKHKMMILGLEKSYEITNNYENDLRESNFTHQKYFESMLPIMINYLKTL